MRLHSIVLVLSLFAIFNGCDAVYDFEVTVVSEDNVPVEGAMVYLLETRESTRFFSPTITNHLGKAKLGRIDEFSIHGRLVVVRDGYLPLVEREQMYKHGTTEIKVILEEYSVENSERADDPNQFQENPMNSVDSGE